MASLRIVGGRASGAEIEIRDVLLIGRSAAGDGLLGDDPELSREHARISRARGGELIIEDLGSTNGTTINGRRISAPEPLKEGDTVQLGSTTLEVVNGRGAQPTQAAAAVGDGGGAQPTTAAPVTAALAGAQAGPRQEPPVASAGPSAPRATAAPAATGPPGLRPGLEPGEGSKRRRFALALGLLILVGAAFVAGLLLSSDEEGGGAEDFAAMAQGVSIASEEPDGRQRLNIELGFIQAPYGLRTLSVDKLLDARRRPPFPVTDGVYTLTAENGDTLTLGTEGTATAQPEPPDNFFARADETWSVTGGTGRFEGASGSGRVLSAVVLEVGGRQNRSAVVKYFVGEIDLDE